MCACVSIHPADGLITPHHTTPNKHTQERLAVLERMAAHAQFCLAGDHTLEATQLAAQELETAATAAAVSGGSAQGDDATGKAAGAEAASFLFVISDCNLSRYRLDPAELGRALTRHNGVRGHIFMIASLGDEAEQVGGRDGHGWMGDG